MKELRMAPAASRKRVPRVVRVVGISAPGVEYCGMPKRITRREFSKLSVLSAVSASLVTAARGEEAGVQGVETQLAKPLPEGTKKLLEAANKYLDSLTKSRMKHKLPENSEPCTVYIVTEVNS